MNKTTTQTTLLINRQAKSKPQVDISGKVDRNQYVAVELQFSGSTKQRYMQNFEFCSKNRCDGCRRPC
jgi:hypothetical protein